MFEVLMLMQPIIVTDLKFHLFFVSRRTVDVDDAEIAFWLWNLKRKKKLRKIRNSLQFNCILWI
jgi:hypothetical protein